MKKIGEIHKGNSSFWKALLIGLFGTILIGYFSLLFLNFDVISYVNEEHIIEILLVLPTMLLFFIIHEYIHVFFFLLFGKGKAKIKVSREKTVGAVVMHQVNPEVYYSRWQMVTILLSPLCILTVLFLILSTFISAPFVLFMNIVLNAFGSSIDMYVSSLLLFKYRSPIQVNFKSEEVVMNIYEK